VSEQSDDVRLELLRALVDRLPNIVWDAVRPRVLAQGHLHVKGEIELADGSRVHSLGCNGIPGNLALLNTQTLEWEWLKD
jgi:hypothetical protein